MSHVRTIWEMKMRTKYSVAFFCTVNRLELFDIQTGKTIIASPVIYSSMYSTRYSHLPKLLTRLLPQEPSQNNAVVCKFDTNFFYLSASSSSLSRLLLQTAFLLIRVKGLSCQIFLSKKKNSCQGDGTVQIDSETGKVTTYKHLFFSNCAC